MFRLIWIVSIHVHELLQRFAPTNRIIAAVRSRRGMKWGVPAMLLAVPYLFLANLLLALIHDGAPGWLHLIVLVCLWNAIKMLLLGPISIVWLVRTLAREGRTVGYTCRGVDSGPSSPVSRSPSEPA